MDRTPSVPSLSSVLVKIRLSILDLVLLLHCLSADCLDMIIEPLLYISDTYLGRVISQSNGIYSGTTIIAGALATI